MKYVPDWNTIKDFLVQFGWIKGTLTIFFWLAHYWIYHLYNARLNDRQKEIDRLAGDNREYRERLLAIFDKQFEYKEKNSTSITVKPDSATPSKKRTRK